MEKGKIHYLLNTRSLALKPYYRKYVQQYHSWFQHDPQLLRLTASELLTFQQELQNHQSWLNDPKKYTFLVFDKTNDKLIGDVNLFFSDWIEPNQAQINIMIAVKQYRGRGLAQQIMDVIQKFVVAVYGKYQIIAKIKDSNKPSINFFEKIGYQFISQNTHHQEVEYRKKLPIQSKPEILKTLIDKFQMKELINLEELFNL